MRDFVFCALCHMQKMEDKMKNFGLCLILTIIVASFASCQYTPSPNTYESNGFASSNVDNSGFEPYDSYHVDDDKPVVGIFHPHAENEVEGDGSSDDMYELASDTELKEIDSSNSTTADIDGLIANKELAKARRVISKKILNNDLEPAEEDALIQKLRSINTTLLTSTDPEGDCKIVTIEKGQTLYAITKANKMTVEAIAALNNMNPSKYNAGQKIKIYKDQFHVIAVLGRAYIYIWQNDHIVDRYPAAITDVKKGIYRLKGKKKGDIGDMIFTQNQMIMPESSTMTATRSIKINDNDYKVVRMLLVSDALLDVK